MDVVLLIARLLLATVFAVAGLAKLTDRDGSRTALVGFGAPESVARLGAVALPVAELVVAVLLLPANTAEWGAIGALVLLLVFTTAIGFNLLRGRTPECHCFGALHSEPAGPRALIRNAVLAAVALVVVAAGSTETQPSALAWLGRLDAAEAALLAVAVTFVVLAATGGFAFVHLLRQHGRLLLRLDRVEQVLGEAGLATVVEDPIPEIGLAPGTTAPDFAVKTLDGSDATLASVLEPGLPALILFTSPACGPCRTLMPSVARWQRIHESVITVAVASGGKEAEIRAEAAEHSIGNVLLDEDHALYSAYEANGTPSAVLIGADGGIASWMASGAEWVERLVADTLAGDRGPVGGLPLGEPAPAVELASLDGSPASLGDAFRGETVVVFWNPQCGFCRQMHPDLIAWEDEHPAGAPEVVIVSAGDAAQVRAEGFRSTVLYDPDWSAMSAFSAGGTPTAIRVDAEGRVASPLASGADAVLQLIRPSATARHASQSGQP